MNDHKEIRSLLALAASGDLQPDEQKRVDGHLRECADCRREFAVLRALAENLRILPEPHPSLGLAARTRARVIAEVAARAERRRQHVLLALLICFGWILTLLTLFLGGRLVAVLAQMMGFSPAQFVAGFIGYTVLTVLASAAFAALIGPRLQATRRAYETLS